MLSLKLLLKTQVWVSVGKNDGNLWFKFIFFYIYIKLYINVYKMILANHGLVTFIPQRGGITPQMNRMQKVQTGNMQLI